MFFKRLLATTATQRTTTTTTIKPKLRQRKALLTITPTAVTRLKQLQHENKFLKVGTTRKGCSGHSYTLDYVTDIKKLDEIVEQDGVKVIVDSKALFSLIGSEMDFVSDVLTSEFKFNNPNVKEMCGCGQSFMV